MNTIHKFDCPIDDTLHIMMPSMAKVLCVQLQNGDPYVWAAVDTNDVLVKRRFNWRGTGHDISGLHNYVGTVQMGTLVFHLFEC